MYLAFIFCTACPAPPFIKLSIADKIIVATSSEPEDDQIENFVKKENIDLYRGSLDDVVRRAYETCLKYGLDRFIRICGDRPFFSPKLATDLIKLSLKEDFDIVTTTFPRTYPPGLTCEILKTELLTENLDLIIEEDDKEHLTSFFYKNPEKFYIKNASPKNQINFNKVVNIKPLIINIVRNPSIKFIKNIYRNNINNLFIK